MDEQQKEIVGHISEFMSQGVTETEIRQVLNGRGFEQGFINQAIEIAKAPSPSSIEPYQVSAPSLQAVSAGAQLIEPELPLGQSQPLAQTSNQPDNPYQSDLVDRMQSQVQPTVDQPRSPLEPQQILAPQPTPGQFQQAQTPPPTSSSNLPEAVQKYKVLSAIFDTFKAIKINFVAFVLATVISYAIIICVFVLASLVIALLIRHHVSSQPLFSSSSSLMSHAIWASIAVIYIAWATFAYTLVLATVSLTLYDGAEGRRSSPMDIVRTGFSRLGRLLMTDLLYVLIMSWPAFLMFLVFFSFVWMGHSNSVLPLLLLPVMIIMSIIWIIFAMLRYALVPYVALLEPETAVRQTLKRSKQLMEKGGRWFVFKGFLLATLIVLILAAISNQSLAEVSQSSNVAMIIIQAFISIVANGVLVMLYLNRKVVKGSMSQ